MKQRLLNLVIVVLSTAIVASLCYGGYVCFRCTAAYLAMKQKTRGWAGRVHRQDDVLGFAPIPGARGAHVFPIGPDIPMRYGRDGFRVPVGRQEAGSTRPLFLFLGCSYTYGDACRAEDTFAWLVADHFGGTALNAGVCGYGLAQMQLLAERLVPRYRPDFVIVQFSDWLVRRATREFSPTYFLSLPYPYYTDDGRGFAIAPPVYRSGAFDTDFSAYRVTPAGIADFFSFMAAAVPLQLYEHLQYCGLLFRKGAGAVPRPTKRKQAALEFCYRRIHDLCRRHGAAMIILGLRSRSYDVPPDFTYVDAEEELHRRLAPGQDYDRAYAHWRGDPPVKVDNHPNPAAHGIIAAQLIDAIEALGKGVPAAR